MAIERSMDKPVFDTGIRAIYLAKKDLLDQSILQVLRGIMRSYMEVII